MISKEDLARMEYEQQGWSTAAARKMVYEDELAKLNERPCPDMKYPPREDKSCWPFEKKHSVHMNELIKYIASEVIKAMEEAMEAPIDHMTPGEEGPEECEPEPTPNSVREICGYGTVEGPKDPWEHRSKGMKCHTCMWYVVKEVEMVTSVRELGRCRRHAPTMNGYPAVYPTDWCGDHKLDQEKI